MLFRLVAIFYVAFSMTAMGQNTEVYLFDLDIELGSPVLTNPKNISNNEGYDNQPSFLNNNTILFSSTRDGQTDILRFNIEEGSTASWVSNTPAGSEYSPLKIPGKNAVSAIRLDLDGTQLLHQYDLETGASTPILENLKVGYHVWANDSVVVSSVLTGNRMDLVVSNLSNGSNKTVQKNVGRSLWKIPNSNLISYISKETAKWEIKSLDPGNGKTKKITQTYGNSEDMCWLDENIMLTGSRKSILKFDVTLDIEWQIAKKFRQDEINNISRIAVNPKGNRLAFVSEESPANIVQKQLDAYNARDLDAFMATYAEDIQLFRFPDQLTAQGQESMKKRYGSFFESTPDLHCEIKNRIVIGNKVIDEEYITANGSHFSAVAIYEVENGKISKVTFVR